MPFVFLLRLHETSPGATWSSATECPIRSMHRADIVALCNRSPSPSSTMEVTHMSHPHHPHSTPMLITATGQRNATPMALWIRPLSRPNAGYGPSNGRLSAWALQLAQVVIVWMSGSVALLADTIHNFGDADGSAALDGLCARTPSTAAVHLWSGSRKTWPVSSSSVSSCAVPLSLAISRSRRCSQPIAHLGAGGAALLGFLGNEAVARLRINVGKAIGSAALMADGYHARVDGWTSLAVLVGTAWLGYPIVDPLVGLVITMVILRITGSRARRFSPAS